MKNIILSTDGTGNAGGKGHGTNVWRLHTAIDRQNHLINGDRIRQIAYYHDGVGTQDNKWLKILGGACGFGLKRTIKELYIFLVNNYEPGDQIYLFGFSRGAYTVRLLACMILECGILNKNSYKNKSDEDLEEDTEQVYRTMQDLIIQQKEVQLEKDNDTSKFMQTTRKSIKELSQKISPLEKLPKDIHLNIKIRFMGVWDTVDAYAIPSDALAKLLDKFFYISFREHDNELSKNVTNACHALSIDDRRRVFEPVLWRERPGSDDHQRIEQVWFPGVHSNIGGGYPKQGMAWNTMEWMMFHAKKAGVQFVKEDVDQFTENKDVQDKLYDSRSGLGAYYVFMPRNISKLWKRYTSRDTIPKIHISVFERIATRTEGYAPSNLPEQFEIVITPPIFEKDNEQEIPNTSNGNLYSKDDILRLEKQVSEALIESNKNQQPLTPYQAFENTVHYWSSYLFFFGLLSFWSIGFLTFSRNPHTLGLSIAISLAYWFIIWQVSKKDKIKKHIEDSTRWRNISSDKAWDFLKR
jgi:uncharacterized protein (DUF2235 family)